MSVEGASRRGDLGEDCVTGGLKERLIDPVNIKSGSSSQLSSPTLQLEPSDLVYTNSKSFSELE